MDDLSSHWYICLIRVLLPNERQGKLIRFYKISPSMLPLRVKRRFNKPPRRADLDKAEGSAKIRLRSVSSIRTNICLGA